MVIEELKAIALENNIPIMQDAGLDFMVDALKKVNANRLLEVGSAIGYSAIYMASHVEGLCIDTLERDEGRANEARKNIAEFQLNERICLHEADALEYPLEKLAFAPYDCLFIDGAKAQYQKFFERYIPLVKEYGLVIVDNLDFHGMIFDIPHIHNRNTRALVRKIKRFKDWILGNEDYDATYYPIGDGIVVITRKGESNEVNG